MSGGFDESRVAKKLGPDLDPLHDREPTKPGASTGNTYIDRGMQCDAVPGQGCYLDTAQRGRAVELFHGRVLSAHGNLMHACTELRIDELLAKEPSKGLIFEALLEVVGLVIGQATSRMFKALQATAARIIGDAQLAENPATSPWLARIVAADSRTVDQVTRSVISLAKKNVPAPGAAPTKVGVAFLDAYQEQSGEAYELIREQAPAMVTDDLGLLLLLDSFRDIHHTVSIYKAEIRSLIDRWKKTQLWDIGTHADGATVPIDPVHASLPPHEEINASTVGPRDVKLFVVDTFGVKKLGIFRRQFRADAGLNRDHVAAPIMMPPMRYDHDQPERMTEDDFIFVGWVEADFAGIAIRAHVANWGSMPTERDIVGRMQLGGKP